MTAWESGCKGCTIYREGSRSGVLVTEKAKKEVKLDRSKKVRAEVVETKFKGQIYQVLVGFDESETPTEIFAFKKSQCLPKEVIIYKKKKDTYKLLSLDGEELLGSIQEEYEHPEFSTVTRLVSTLLKHGGIDIVIKQLQKSTGIIVEYGKVLARVLRKYAKTEGEAKPTGNMCPECGEAEIIFEGGCEICPNCGFSAKCG